MLVGGVLQTDKTYMGVINGNTVTAAPTTRTNGTQLNFLPPTLANNTTAEYDALYGTLGAQTHSASISMPHQRQYATVTMPGYNRDSDSGADHFDQPTTSPRTTIRCKPTSA